MSGIEQPIMYGYRPPGAQPKQPPTPTELTKFDYAPTTTLEAHMAALGHAPQPRGDLDAMIRDHVESRRRLAQIDAMIGRPDAGAQIVNAEDAAAGGLAETIAALPYVNPPK